MPIARRDDDGHLMEPARIRDLLGEEDVEQIRSELALEDFAAAYCRYFARVMASDEDITWDEDPDGWAAELYFERDFWSSHDGWNESDEERLRSFLLLIVEAAANDDVLGFIGAGPFEDFLANDESRIAWVEAQAAMSSRFRKVLSNVWISSWASEETFVRLESAAQTELAWPDSQWPRPGTRELSQRTPEEAAVAWFLPHQTQATPVGSRIDGDEAYVWLLTRDVPAYYISMDGVRMRPDAMGLTADPVPVEEYEAVCIREDGLWRRTAGRPGFSPETPADIRESAATLKKDAS